MGLDMYLYVGKYVSVIPNVPLASDPATYDTIVKATGLTLAQIEPNDIRSVTVSVRVAYWRKANAIHQWFVTNVQDGKDECQTSEVDREQLTTLRDLCQSLLQNRNPQEAAELLPTQPGFFFGSTDIGDYYWQDLQDTVSMLNRALTHTPQGCYFEYHASW